MRLINWLASYPKSGNTWARLFYQAYVTGNAGINANLRVTLTDSYAPLYQAVTPFSLQNLEPADYALLRGAALVNLIGTGLRSHIVCKTHNAAISIGDMPIIPNAVTASAVYIVRDPRDVACSYAAHLGKDIDEIIGTMNDEKAGLTTNGGVVQYVSSWSAHVASWMDRAVVMRYEDVMTNPVHWFSKMLETWGVEVDKDRVVESVEMTSIDKFRAQEEREGFVEISSDKTFFRCGGSRWKETLTDKQAQRIRRHHQQIMSKFNYG